MQISSITNFATSGVNYFLESSWKGKTVQVLGALSIFALFYYVFLKKALPKGPETPTPLNGRVENKEKTPTGPNTSPVNSSSGVQTQTRTEKSSSVKTVLLKPDFSYSQETQVDPDFKLPQSEFDIWLSYQMADFPQWSAWAGSGDQAREGDCRRALIKCIPELKTQVNKMIPVFEKYDLKRRDAGAFLQDCNEAVIDQKTNLLDFCIKLKGYLERLQCWNTELHKRTEEHWKKNLKNVDDYHYEFTNLQTQYFDYLGLHKIDDFSRLLDTNIDYLEKFGLRNMEDVNCLQLTNMQPLIERLRQLVHLFMVMDDEKAVRPLIEKEIERCREVLTISEDISRGLYSNYGQKLKETVENLRELFVKLACNIYDELGLLNTIEQNDIERQKILLKGYINQSGLRAKWEQLNGSGIVSLAHCAQVYKISTQAQFYRMDKLPQSL